MLDLNDKVKQKVKEREEHWMNVNLAKGEIWNNYIQLKDIVVNILHECKNRSEAWHSVNAAFNALTSSARNDIYGKVLKQITQQLVDGELVISGWESEDHEPKAPKESNTSKELHTQHFHLIPFIKDAIRFREMEEYKACDTETEEAIEKILNPMMSDLITDENFLKDAVKEFITKDINFRFDRGDTYILGEEREDLKEEMNSEECWEYLAKIITRFI